MLRPPNDESSEQVPPLPARPDGVQLRARRSPRLIAVGVLCVVLSALGAAALYNSTVNHASAVVMTRDLMRGDTIQPEDLGIVSVPQDLRVDFVTSEEMASLVGQTARTDLPAGAFPSARLLGEEPIPEGHSLVGLRLGPGRMPSAPLPPGTAVQLVSLAEGDTSVTDATVSSAPLLLDDGTGYTLDVLVPDERAHSVAVLAAADQLALIAVGKI